VEGEGRADAVSRPSAGWLVSPAFDLVFVANLGWLLLLVPGAATETDTVASFWQIYFLTLPHRWITLVLVALDPDRRAGRAPKLLGTALVALAFVVGVYFGTGGLTCLAVVDFVWNAWHFGAQHSGILRMYSLKAGAGPSIVERWGLRIFVCYTLLRTAAWTTGWTIGDAALERSRNGVDTFAILLPAAVLFAALFNGRKTFGRMAYLASVVGLYGGLLVALMSRADAYVLPLMAASALFHAAEYLAIVSIYANRRRSVGSPGHFRALAESWPTFLLLYVVTLGSLGVVLEGTGPQWAEIWLAVNVWAALVHYAFDGMIWKLRTPDTARALGAEATVRP
jgi:hypothetical protein